MLDPFSQKKQAILAEIGATNGGIPDLSPKGSIDEICIPIINLINSSADMVTTSSCSGRVSVFLEGKKSGDEIKIGAKGNEGRWIFVTHDPRDLDGWYNNVGLSYRTASATDPSTRYILYKFEPLILHVKCRDHKSANALYTAAMGCGFRESGIGSNNLVAIRTSIKLDIPIGYLHNDELVSIVSKEYLELATKLSVDRFSENFKKLEGLKKAIEGLLRPKEEKEKESKEQRRERKIREGLERRERIKSERERGKEEKEKKEKEEKKENEQNEQK